MTTQKDLNATFYGGKAEFKASLYTLAGQENYTSTLAERTELIEALLSTLDTYIIANPDVHIVMDKLGSDIDNMVKNAKEDYKDKKMLSKITPYRHIKFLLYIQDFYVDFNSKLTRLNERDDLYD